MALGGILVAMGLNVTSGWLLHVPAMVEIKSGMVPMVFNTGLGFMLAGAALALSQYPGERTRRLCLALGSFLVLFSALTFLEHVLDTSLGVDLAFVHMWHDYGNTRPGRMAPNTALGFILIGATLLVSNRVAGKRQALALVALTFAILAIGMTGLVGYFLTPDLLFGWARSARMALHTACGMILCSIGFWRTWSKSWWYVSQEYVREDEKIRFLGSFILVVVTMTASLTGFVLLESGLQRSLEGTLENIVRNRAPWFNATVTEMAQNSRAAVRLAGFDKAGTAFLLNGHSQADEARLSAPGNSVLAGDIRGVALRDGNGRHLAAFGTLNASPAIAAPLSPDGTAELAWDEVLLVRTYLPLFEQDRKIGDIVVDHSATALEKVLFNVTRLGKTGEINACLARGNDELWCFPGSGRTFPFSIDRSNKQGLSLALAFAIAGQGGHVHMLDYRGKNVIAAYGPLAPGLGMVAKEDTEEVYAVIREALQYGVPFVLAICALGVLLLHSQLRPLAERMLVSETAAHEKEMEVRAIMESAGDGILTVDERSVIRSVNAMACGIFGYEPHELIGQDLAVLILREEGTHIRDAAGLANREQRGPAGLLGMPNMEVEGRRKDGERFPLELTVSQVSLSGKHLFVGVMRDITERKEVQRRLAALAQYDSLTGLPNRLLFTDRLATAMLRVERSGSAIGLMFLDLDGFKQVNDTLGHQAGDELLIQFARRLSSMVRKTDAVARLAGDEFTILLEGLVSPAEDGKAIAEKIIASMQQPFVVCRREVSVTVSIGLAIHDANSGAIDVAELLRRADKQMYAAKHAGKNAYSMA